MLRDNSPRSPSRSGQVRLYCSYKVKANQGPYLAKPNAEDADSPLASLWNPVQTETSRSLSITSIAETCRAELGCVLVPVGVVDTAIQPYRWMSCVKS